MNEKVTPWLSFVLFILFLVVALTRDELHKHEKARENIHEHHKEENQANGH